MFLIENKKRKKKKKTTKVKKNIIQFMMLQSNPLAKMSNLAVDWRHIQEGNLYAMETRKPALMSQHDSGRQLKSLTF